MAQHQPSTLAVDPERLFEVFTAAAEVGEMQDVGEVVGQLLEGPG
jgi:hypothetical protein